MAKIIEFPRKENEVKAAIKLLKTLGFKVIAPWARERKDKDGGRDKKSV